MRKPVAVLLLLLLISAVGCSSLSTWVKSNMEGVPVWVYEPQVTRTQIAFVGKGTATNENRARVLSYESVLSQLSVYIGEDVIGRHIAELSSRNAIESYRLKVTQEFVKVSENAFEVYFLAIADSTVLEKARTESEVQLLEKQQEMDRLSDLGAKAFRENKDIVAAKQYLGIAKIASSLPVDRGAKRYEESIARIRPILEALNLSVSVGDPSLPTTEVTLRRGTRTLSPRVVEAPITVRTTARNGMGEPYADSQRFVTDSNGQFTYTTNNPSLVGQGDLVLYIDLEAELEFLKEFDPDVHSQLMQIVQSKQIYYPYSRISIVGDQSLVVAVFEFSLQGDLLESVSANTSIAQNLSKDGIITAVASPQRTDDDEETFADLRSMYPDSTYALFGNAGISQSKPTTDGATVTIIGETFLINLKTGVVVGSTGNVRANSIAPTLDEAQRSAFARFGTITASLMYRYLYR